VDKGIQYPSYTSTPSSQLAVVYYYVVTAVRGTEESAYSAENAAWPNYLVSGSSPPVYSPRYDQDNLGDFGCDDETSSIEVPVDDGVAIADVSLDQEAEQEFEARMSSYVVIGNRRSGGGGGGGGGGSAPPPVARWLFLHSDHLGSPRVVMDDAGNKVSGHHYMPFGEEKPLGTRLTSNAAKFTGHERDVESASFDNPDGLDYMSARYYSSSLGRFMAVDPGDDTDPQNPQSWNKYAYVRNSPLNAIDRKGTDTFFLPANQQQLNQAIATAPAAAARVQRDRDIAAGRKESMQRMENALGGTSKIATGVAVLAGVASLIPGPHQALSIPLAIKAEIIATCADVGKLTIDRSNENVITVGIDVVGGGTMKSVGGFLAREGKAFSEPVGHVVGGAMLGAATLLAPKLDEAIGGPSTGGDDTSVDRAIADKEARAAKGPAPKEKKK
jgi:RHS repeat-associated protein